MWLLENINFTCDLQYISIRQCAGLGHLSITQGTNMVPDPTSLSQLLGLLKRDSGRKRFPHRAIWRRIYVPWQDIPTSSLQTDHPACGCKS